MEGWCAPSVSGTLIRDALLGPRIRKGVPHRDALLGPRMKKAMSWGSTAAARVLPVAVEVVACTRHTHIRTPAHSDNVGYLKQYLLHYMPYTHCS